MKIIKNAILCLAHFAAGFISGEVIVRIFLFLSLISCAINVREKREWFLNGVNYGCTDMYYFLATQKNIDDKTFDIIQSHISDCINFPKEEIYRIK